ncbi:hypothetical protein AMTRI_Chr07g80200 [Amborella trichopoda]
MAPQKTEVKMRTENCVGRCCSCVKDHQKIGPIRRRRQFRSFSHWKLSRWKSSRQKRSAEVHNQIAKSLSFSKNYSVFSLKRKRSTLVTLFKIFFLKPIF